MAIVSKPVPFEEILVFVDLATLVSGPVAMQGVLLVLTLAVAVIRKGLRQYLHVKI